MATRPPSWLWSDRRHAVAAVGEPAALRDHERETPRQLLAEVLGLHDGVDDEIGRETEEIDVLLVLAPPFLDEGLALVERRRSP